MDETIGALIVILSLILGIGLTMAVSFTIWGINTNQGIEKCIAGGNTPPNCYCGFNSCK